MIRIDAILIMRLVLSHLQAVLWRYKFSQLKGSSDDGKSKIKFLFQNQDSKAIEAKVTHKKPTSCVIHQQLHLHLGHLADSFIQSDLQ